MIESMTIKKVATFDEEGIVIDKLKKVNFIYGANGSGKTTISNMLNNPLEVKYCNCSIAWKNNLSVTALVYNRVFREQNFGKGKIAGVFTLGKATKEDIEKIEGMQAQLQGIKEKGIQKKTTIENQEKSKKELNNNFEEQSWTTVYKKYEHIFNSAFDGAKSKERFKNKLLSEHKANNKKLKTKEELIEKAKVLFGEAPQLMEEIFFIDFQRLLEIERDIIWKNKLIGKADVGIAQLIQRLDLNDWVNQGRQYIQDNDSLCPFCQKNTITADFKKQLEDYFDETFIDGIEKIKRYSTEYISLFENIINLLQEIEYTQKNNKETKLKIDLFLAAAKTLNSEYISNKESIINKLKEPSRSIELISTKEQFDIIQILLSEANDEIKKHNILVNNYKTERTNLISDIWKYLIEENSNQIKSFINSENGLQAGIDKLTEEKKKLNNEYRDLENRIKEANKNVTSTQASIDEINKVLTSYGFTNFEIVPFENNQYQIKRENGEIAEGTLSEGEVTFITFLYFLQLTKGGISAEVANQEKILVVDDPISSLDSTILFVVSSLLKEIIKSVKKGTNNIKQIIILTHNVYFHKEITFVDRSDNNRDDVCFWILRKNANISNIQCYEKKNPIRGSYELLWDELKHRDQLSGITIQNTMRRILETYFKTMGKYTDDGLINSFESRQEQEICRTLICWINDGSHCISDDLHVEYQDAINDKFFDVFRKVFENTQQIEHYNMMMGITTEETI